MPRNDGGKVRRSPHGGAVGACTQPGGAPCPACAPILAEVERERQADTAARLARRGDSSGVQRGRASGPADSPLGNIGHISKASAFGRSVTGVEAEAFRRSWPEGEWVPVARGVVRGGVFVEFGPDA